MGRDYLGLLFYYLSSYGTQLLKLCRFACLKKDPLTDSVVDELLPHLPLVVLGQGERGHDPAVTVDDRFGHWSFVLEEGSFYRF